MGLPEEPMHPGEVLKELYLDHLDMGVIALARRLGVPRIRIERLVKGVTGMTPDTALRLARAFNTTPGLLDEHADKSWLGCGIQRG